MLNRSSKTIPKVGNSKYKNNMFADIHFLLYFFLYYFSLIIQNMETEVKIQI